MNAMSDKIVAHARAPHCSPVNTNLRSFVLYQPLDFTLTHWFWRRKLLNVVNVFSLLFTPLKRAWPFVQTRIQINQVCLISVKRIFKCWHFLLLLLVLSPMVAYFCHHLWDNYVDMSDLYVDLSDIMSTCQIILFLSVWHKLGKNKILKFIF